MIAIVDYGVGNLFSLQSSFQRIGADAVVTGDWAVIESADRILLPGVGAFEDAAAKLRESGLDEVVRAQAKTGKYMMGICLGMQLLFDESHEFGSHKGLGLIPGRVVDMTPEVAPALKVPHIGWNALHLRRPDHPLFRYIEEGDCVYFVHTYFATDCESAVLADTEYGRTLTAAVGKDNILGCQFHPEKSGNVGLNILRAFCEL